MSGNDTIEGSPGRQKERLAITTILCYGDSNTWGTEPGTGKRLGRKVRWPGVLRQRLGRHYDVIEEGLGGRTTVFDDPLSEHRNGKTYFAPCLESHQPLDIITIMLGTNDVQTRFAASAIEIAWGMELLVGMARAFTPAVLLIAPPNLARIPHIEEGAYRDAAEKMRQLPSLYRDIAHANDCLFLDASQIIVSSNVDGIHFDAAEHQKLGDAVAEVIRGFGTLSAP